MHLSLFDITKKATPPNTTSPAMINDFENMIQMYINENEPETDWDTLSEVI